MSDESKPSVLEEFRKYLGEANLAPGYIGAALGAGASAFYTADQPGETPGQRAKRLIRNALVGGSLGGIGTQALAEGLGSTAQIIGNTTPGSSKHTPSWLSGTLARLGYATAGSQVGRLPLPNAGLPSTRRRLSVERAFGSKGLGNVSLGGLYVADFGVPNSNSLADRVEHAKNTLSQIRNANVVDSTDTRVRGMMATLLKHLKGSNRERNMGGTDSLRRWLLAEGVPASDKTLDIVTSRLRGVDRALNSFTPHATSRGGRWTGRVLSLGGAATGFMTPDILNGIGSFINRQAGKVNPLEIPVPGKVVEAPTTEEGAWDKMNKGFNAWEKVTDGYDKARGAVSDGYNRIF